jgi:hypothetical protein
MEDIVAGRPGINDSVRAAIAVPDVVPSPLGDLHFFDGVPSLESVETIYDLLDLVRGIDVYLNTIPGASLVAMRSGFRSVGVDGAGVLGYTAPRANSGSFFLTANTETTYGSMFLDLKADGPTVIENPPTSAWPGRTGAPAASTSSCRPATTAPPPPGTSSTRPPPTPTGSWCARSAGSTTSSRPACTR